MYIIGLLSANTFNLISALKKERERERGCCPCNPTGPNPYHLSLVCGCN